MLIDHIFCKHNTLPVIVTDGAMHESLAKLGEELRFVLITSSATLKPLSAAPANVANINEQTDSNNTTADLVVEVNAAAGTKCVRCWHIRDDIGTDSAHPELCARCATNVSGDGEVRHYA